MKSLACQLLIAIMLVGTCLSSYAYIMTPGERSVAPFNTAKTVKLTPKQTKRLQVRDARKRLHTTAP